MDYKLNIESFKFERKPEAVPYKNRISYKVIFICYMIKNCSKNSGCSLDKMKIISSYSFSKKQQDNLIKILQNNKDRLKFKEDILIVKAVNYMYSEGLVVLQKDGKYKLSDKGKRLTTKAEEKYILEHETSFFIRIGKLLPESYIKKMKKEFVRG